MKLTTVTESVSADFSISHNEKIVLIGSCFSDEMAGRFSDAGFNVNANPFGTIFHPSAIANVIGESIDQSTSVNQLQRDDVHFAWEASSKLYGNNAEELKSRIIESREILRNDLQENAVLIITFGTAWAYWSKELDRVVGNCHKASSELFNRELSTRDEIIGEWKFLLAKLKELNPSLKIIFTVSPVRHAKDGLIGNNRSKAELISAVHELCVGSINYFPSYEIVIDELRDYRFYAEDLVHPSKLAVDIVFNRFGDTYFNEQTIQLCLDVRKVKSLIGHKSLFPGTKADEERSVKAEQLKQKLIAQHPEINL